MNASGTDSVIISPPANVSAPPPVITPPVNEPDAPVVSPAVSVPVTDTATSVASSSVPVVVKKENSFCSNVATQEDYMRLRRKMALENTDDKMIREAKKMYRDKCFSTHQIKVLSTLFLSDEGRYRFFTASFSFVSDPASYSSLLSEFIDPFYINRFKSIVE